MTPEEETNCALCVKRIEHLEEGVMTLNTAVFNGDARDRSIKDRTYANEVALSAVRQSIDGIAQHMRQQESDKRKLMLVVIGGSLTFFSSAVLMIVSKFMGV